MKVLMLRSNPVNPDPRVEKEADTLLKAGYSVDIFCWDRSSNHPIEQNSKQLESGNCVINRIGIESTYGAGFKKNLKPLLLFQLAILRYLKANSSKYFSIHACDFDTALAAYLGKGKCKLVYDIFDYYSDAFSVPHIFKRLIKAIDSHIITHSDAVIICSEQRLKQLETATPKKLAVIHNSPKEVQITGDSTRKEHRKSFRIAYVGILNEGRMIPELLELVADNREYELYIAGFGKYETLTREYSEKCDNIKFFGRVDYNRALQLEAASELMIATYDPSIKNHRYAAPNKYYEALMLGKPIIMCDGTGFANAVADNRIGRCVKYSKESLQEGIEYVRVNYDDYEKKSELERNLYKNNYSWEIMETRLKELYQTL